MKIYIIYIYEITGGIYLKRVFRLVICLTLFMGVLGGCAKKTDNKATATPADTANATAAPTDNSTIYMIETFNNISDPVTAMKPIDLKLFGVETPKIIISSDNAEEGKALKVQLNPNCWCQAFQIDDAIRISVFTTKAISKYYLRMYISNPSQIAIGFTINLKSSTKSSFLDSTFAVLTDTTGNVIENESGNSTGDAGDDSALIIPGEFTGWVAWSLSDAALKPWATSTRLTDLTKVSYIKIDVRPSGPVDGDFYVLDNLCLTDSAHGVVSGATTTSIEPTGKGATATPTVTQTLEFDIKNEELAYMLTQTMNATPQFEYCPEYNPVGFPNIKSIWFTGAKFGTKDTKVFAYIGLPTGASASSRVPAVVLQHGGGGYAYPTWIKIWNDLGYAAIAVCNTGYYPSREGISDFYGNGSWKNSLNSTQRAADSRILAPNNDGMSTSNSALNRQWMYHAVTQTVIANNILRNDERIDKTKVGLTGISWGGVITSVAIGYDTRFAFAVPVYGSGYLYESLAWMKNNFNSAGTKALWDPSLTLKNAKMPVLWLGWTNDTCFSINSHDKSFADTPKGVLSMQMNMLHGHIQGWNPSEIYCFADSVVKNVQPLTTFKTQPAASRDVSFTINKPTDTTKITAKVYYIKEKMTYSTAGWQKIAETATIDQVWSSVNCMVNNVTITTTLPSDAYSFYVEITTIAGDKNYVTTSRFITID